MSRSRKKHPIYKWKWRGGKKASSKAFRRFEGDIPTTSRQFFRRVYNSYNVWDDWWYDFDNLKERQQFRSIIKELEQNALDKHLSEEEAYELLERLKELKYCFLHSK